MMRKIIAALFAVGFLTTFVEAQADKAARSLSVLSYGAKGDWNTDDQPAIQKAIDAACAQSKPPKVFFPHSNSSYNLGKPLRVYCDGLVLEGESRYSAQIQATFAPYGPMVVVAPAVSKYGSVPLGQALVRGRGSSMSFDGSNQKYLNLRDSRTMEMNGVAAFTVELFYQPASVSDGGRTLISSSGRRLTTDPVHTAFYLKVDDGGQLFGGADIGGTLKQLSGGTLSADRVFHVALSYDGSTLRLFLDGMQRASVPARGNLVQNVTEDVVLGPQIQDWPEGTLHSAGPKGLVDSVRISSNGRYTSNFTKPVTKLASDPNTLLLLNFDNQWDIFTGAYDSSGYIHAWLPLRRMDMPTYVINIEMRNLDFNCGNTKNGVYVFLGVRGTYENLHVAGNCMVNWLALNNSYENTIRDLHIDGGTDTNFGYVASHASGAGTITNLLVLGGKYQYVCFNGCSPMFAPFLANSSTTIANLLAKDVNTNDISIYGGLMDNENNGANFEAAAIFNGLDSVNIFGGSYESGSAPSIKVAGGTSYLFAGTRFNTSASVLSIISAPAQPVVFFQSYNRGSGGWTDTAGSAVAYRAGQWMQVTSKPAMVSFSTGPTFDASQGSAFKITLMDNVTSSTLSNARAGQLLTFQICQDRTGSRTFVYPTNVKGATTIGAKASTCSVQQFYFDGTNAYAVAAGASNQ